MGESRQELLAWLNNLLQLNVTKVEQCGTGAALCQIYDSIFQDLPMSRVKFNVNTEYAYIQNFKILQSKSTITLTLEHGAKICRIADSFTKHQIERLVPVESLVKCKMQDNLEFLQWSKRYWDQYYPGGDYDALARRKGSGAATASAPAQAAHAPPRTSTGAGAGAGAARRGTTPTVTPGARGKIGGGNASSALAQENALLKDTVAGLERERDFYFSKLRDIELLIQTAIEADPKVEEDEDGLVKHCQAILYSTEEGFEIPAEAEGGVPDDQETF